MLLVLFISLLALTLGPRIDSQATNITSALESPFNYLGTKSSGPVAPAGTGSSSAAKGNNTIPFYYVGASTNLASEESNFGVRSVIQVRDQSIDNGVLSFWISEAFANNMWAQTGYYIDNGSSPTAFYQIWNLTARAEITTGTEPVSEGMHIFSISAIIGTDNWNFSLDGKSFGSFDMETNVSSFSYPIYAMSEEGYSHGGPFSFEPVLFQSAIQVLKVNSWSNATSASSFGSDWGLQGHSQNLLLGNDEIAVGNSYTQLNASQDLWV